MDSERIFARLDSNAEASIEFRKASHQAFRELMNQGYRMQLLEQLIGTLKSYDSVFLLLQTLKKLTSDGFGNKEMTTSIDDSCYSASDWGKAIISFLNHVKILHEDLNLRSMISYLCCCAEAAAANPIMLPFHDQVDEMLDTFGYTGEE